VTAAHLLRSARERAGLTQSELASRAGVPQSTVSAYESGSREPGFAAFEKLISAAGLEVRVGSVSALERARRKRAELGDALRPFGVGRIRVFGSVARGEETAQSDIDLLVDLDAPVGVVALGRIRSAASEVLGMPVDVVPSDSLRKSIRDEVLGEAVPL
jgi:predicted nucleotidyltransferase/DNA-binding XRE family transcriptional regulator